MPKPATWPPACQGARPLPETVRTFLIESERRVLLHCQKLLAKDPPAERERLLRLVQAAEQEVERLTGRHESEAA